MSIELPNIESLNLNIDEIEESVESEIKHSKFFRKQIMSEYYRQKNDEEIFLKKHVWGCPPNPSKSIVESMNDSKLNLLDIKHKKYFFLDYNGLEKLSCFIQKIILFNTPNIRSGYNFVKNTITNTRLIGPSSNNGFAISSDIMDKYKDLILIKAPKDSTKYSAAAVNHELVVGKTLNRLRSYIPNFAYVLGSFECGPPIVSSPTHNNNENGKLISWCRGGKKVKYIIYEFIRDSISLKTYIKNISSQEFMDIYLQMIYSLMISYNEVGFTHNDLHIENILIKSIGGFDNGFYIPYQGDYVYGKKVATFIDYGLSHVYILNENGEKVSVGMKDTNGPKTNIKFIEYGIETDKPNPARDCYSLLLNCLFWLKFTNKKVFSKVKGLIRFFHDDSDTIDEIFRRKNYGDLTLYGTKSYMDKIKEFRYERYIRYCREYCNLNDLQDPAVSGRDYVPEMKNMILSPVLNNSVNSIIWNDENDSKEILNKNIHTIHDLFDLIEPLIAYNNYITKNEKMFGGKEKTFSQHDIVIEIFNKIKNNNKLIEKLVNNEIMRLTEEIPNIKNVFYKKLNTNDIYILRSNSALETYNNNIYNSINYLDTFDTIEHILEMIKYLKDNFNIDLDQSKLTKLFKIFKDKDHRDIIIRLIKNDMNTIIEYLKNRDSYDEHDVKLENIYQSLVSSIPN